MASDNHDHAEHDHEKHDEASADVGHGEKGPIMGDTITHRPTR